jgi:tetratricopeptide (TPR) repeat protein
MLGRHLEGEGDLDAAIRAYREAADLDPDTGEILGELASLHARRNEPDEAIRVATEAVGREPDNLTANRILGLVLASRVGGGQASTDVAGRAIDYLEKARGTLLPDLQVELMLARLRLGNDQSGLAIGILEDLLEDEPGLVEAGLLLSEAFEAAERTEDAVAMLERVIGSGRPSSRALRRLGELYGRLDRWPDAVEAYELSASVNPRSTGTQRELANALLRAGQGGRARDVLRDLSEARPDDVSILYQLSQVYLELGDYDEAEVAARGVLSLEPDGIRGPYALAAVYARQHAYRDVVDTLEPAVEAQRPATSGGEAGSYEFAGLLGQLGSAYEQLQDHDGAIRSYSEAFTLFPTSLSYGARLAQAYLDAGRPGEAEQTIDQLAPHYPENLTLARLEARALGDGGDVEGGRRILRDRLERGLSNPARHLALASYLRGYDRFEEATETLETAERRFPDNVAVLFQLGAILEQSQRYADAERAFRDVLDHEPAHAATLNYLGYMLADRGERLEESVDLLQRAIAVDPHNGAYLDSLGWAYFKLDRLDLAEPNLRRASEQMVWNSVIQDHLGDLMFELGRYGEAVVAWEASLAGDLEGVDAAVIEQKIQDAQRRAR